MFSLGGVLYVCNQWAFADNCADAGDQLLIYVTLVAGEFEVV